VGAGERQPRGTDRCGALRPRQPACLLRPGPLRDTARLRRHRQPPLALRGGEGRSQRAAGGPRGAQRLALGLRPGGDPQAAPGFQRRVRPAPARGARPGELPPLGHPQPAGAAHPRQWPGGPHRHARRGAPPPPMAGGAGAAPAPAVGTRGGRAASMGTVRGTGIQRAFRAPAHRPVFALRRRTLGPDRPADRSLPSAAAGVHGRGPVRFLHRARRPGLQPADPPGEPRRYRAQGNHHAPPGVGALAVGRGGRARPGDLLFGS